MGQAGDFLDLLEHAQLLKALAMWHSWHEQILTVYAAKKTITYGILLLLWRCSYPCFSAVNSSFATNIQDKTEKEQTHYNSNKNLFST